MADPTTVTGWRRWRPVRKAQICLSGFLYAARVDRSVTFKTALSLLTVAFAIVCHEWVDVMLLLTVTGLMLVAEMFNTSLEQLCDHVESRHHEQIGRIKDVAAAAAGVAGLVWGVVLAGEAIRLGTGR
ncbi:MAG: diacylglycerol kinase [Fimbriimonadaceae bacterium]|nr:diacylglycerol kinase [Fimbriimonadaceae bacterium]